MYLHLIYRTLGEGIAFNLYKTRHISRSKDVMVDETKIPVFQWLARLHQPRKGPQNAVVSHPSFKASLTFGPAWLEALLFNAKLIMAGADAFPFPYVKGIFGTVVFLLEAVQKVKQNQESMKELCGDTVDIIMVLRDQISAHGDTAALKFKTQCEELEVFLQDVLETVNQLRIRPRGFGARFKEISDQDAGVAVKFHGA
ncbi:hypothetical protein C8R44DRAFT_754016 [Mycena epipterygia]|nr:hypothetical protein C8R44DRAFT_754016 [Mycena epipterygia]